MRRMMFCAFFLTIFLAGKFAVAGSPALLLRQPSVSATQIVFNYAGDLWIVSREGGDARRLTSNVGTEMLPHFSPDGKLVAFTGEYDGNRDVYVVAAAGGQPRRLTFHPAEEDVVGWTPDGKRILFASAAASPIRFQPQLFSVPLEGGLPTQYAVPSATEGSLSADGLQLAYVPHAKWQEAWKRYHGGQTTPIWIADLKDSRITKVPRENSNDHHPMWVGGKIYFLSDRAGPVSLFVYDTVSQKVSEALHSDGLDFKSAAATDDAIVVEQFGGIKLFDLKSGKAREVAIRVTGDIDALRPHFSKVEAGRIQNFGISPTGTRAVFEAWGEIFTVPTDKGDIRNLTHSPGVADRDPAWSPDGRWIAYFSDEGGEYELCIREQNGFGEVRHLKLGNPPSYFYAPRWSPDSKKIAYSDKRLQLWYLELANPTPKLVDTDYYEGFRNAPFQQSWSADSQWMTYQRSLVNGLSAVFVYSLERGKAFQLTDGMSDARFPNFDRNGKYLYFTASTNVGLSNAGLDMSSDEHPVARSVYVAVLNASDSSPLAPESDEEKAAAEEKKKDADKERKEEVPAVKIDVEGMSQRILALPIPARNYANLLVGKTGILFLSEGPQVAVGEDEPPAVTIQKFDLSKRKVDKVVDEVNDFVVSENGEKILYRKGEGWSVMSADEGPTPQPKPGFGPLKLDGWVVYVEPRAMWKQIYNETWRIERDFFYDPHHHGLDLEKVKKKYEPYLAGIASRAELTDLFEESLGELTVGHMFIGGGEVPEVKKRKAGLLGADYAVENGRYQFVKVLDGENWNPGNTAPLTQPGVNVKAGEYLLAVNGRELTAKDSVYSFFEETAGKQVVLKVGGSADGKGSREVTVVPVESEGNLRHLAWIEGNRRRVDEATGGRVAYVHVPDTAGAGYTSFNRYYFAQVGREAAIIDERFNSGGQLADYIVNYLNRPLLSKVVTREGHDWSSPSAAIYGPKVMLINEMSGSGGDALPWYFRKMNTGTLVGKRTWGGLVGIGGYPELLDGGNVTAPRAAIYGLSGEWEVENKGIAPDVDVELEPAAWRQGRDAQLEKAIEVALQKLKEHPLPEIKRPAYPNYHENDGLGVQ